MDLRAPTMEQSGLISIVAGVLLKSIYTQVQVRKVNNGYRT